MDKHEEIDKLEEMDTMKMDKIKELDTMDKN